MDKEERTNAPEQFLDEKAQEEIGVNLVFMLIEGASKKGVIEEVFNFIGSILE